jgi:hypothetical protein
MPWYVGDARLNVGPQTALETIVSVTAAASGDAEGKTARVLLAVVRRNKDR